MASRMPPQAIRLLDAHVAYVMEQLQGAALEALLGREIDEAFADARRVTLAEAVTPHMIKATARTYAVEIELSGAIPELIGDIARTLYAHPVHRHTRLRDLLPDGLFDEFLEKFLEMEDLHAWIAHEAIANPVYTALATDVVVEGIRGYLQHNRNRAHGIPGVRQASALGANLLRGALPMIEEALEENLRAYLQRSIGSLLKGSESVMLGLFDREQVRLLVTEAWEAVRDRRVADFQEGVSSLDIEEIFVIGYELWRSVRHTAFYGSLIDAGVDAFFDKYGDTSLREILDEMGVSREIALREGMRFAPHALDLLRQRGMLEPIVRRHLVGFYNSAAVADILETPAGDNDAAPATPSAARATQPAGTATIKPAAAVKAATPTKTPKAAKAPTAPKAVKAPKASTASTAAKAPKPAPASHAKPDAEA